MRRITVLADAPPDADVYLTTGLGWLAWMAAGACIVGIFIVGGQMAIARHVGGDPGGHQLLWVLVAAAIFSSAAAIATEVV